MDDDQQVAVMLQLNLNGSEGNLPWQDRYDSLTNDVSTSESVVNEHLNLPTDQNEVLTENDLDFIKKHAGDADQEFLHSLLNTQKDNPNRLEAIMCDVLNIPNAAELIKEHRNSAKVGEKRSFHEREKEDCKRQKKNSEKYLQQVRDMFPDADGLFLIGECQQLESEEDFSRFVNTVMISGVYPKKKEFVEYSLEKEPEELSDVVTDNHYRSPEIIVSDDDFSSDWYDSPGKRSGRKSSIEESLSSSEIEVIDIGSENTEGYDPPELDQLQEIIQADALNTTRNFKDVSPDLMLWEAESKDEIDDLDGNRFGTPRPFLQPNNDESKLSVREGTYLEKSVAEIIEEGRLNARPKVKKSTFPQPGPSTSKDNVYQNISSPEVGTSTESKIIEETIGAEEKIKISEEWLNEQTANLIRIFPNTDPSYLRKEVEKMEKTSEAVNEFVYSKLEKNDMPTRAEYDKKMEMEELQNRYTKNFSIQDFLKAVPDPWKYFTDKNRNCAKYKSHSLSYLKSAFRKCYVRDILESFNKNDYNLYITYQDLKKDAIKMRHSRRSEFECNSNRPTTIDIQFLQEVAFIENESKIKDYLEGERIAKQIKFEEAKRAGSLLECQCCFDTEVMVEDIVYCPKDHPFCKDCVVKCVEVQMGNGRCQFDCLATCDQKFTLSSLQAVLKPELFSKVIQANQMEEIKAAEIEDLVQCPFCNYATIMPPEERIMACLNPECLKESCRLCKELNHIPLRCDEVEKSEEVKMRTYIENKMTEALVRTCYKCGKKFVKEDGCNKMTCTCGAKMCYVCRKPVKDYSHFNGQGGTEYHKCPLYSKNDELHVDLVRVVAEDAKAEILQANPEKKLMHDPTFILPERSQEGGMPGTDNGAALKVALRAIRGLPNSPEPEAVRQNRHRRNSTREDNFNYDRYHIHRQQHHQRDIEDEYEEDLYYRYRHRHHHHHNHHQHRGHQQQVQEPQHRHHQNHWRL